MNVSWFWQEICTSILQKKNVCTVVDPHRPPFIGPKPRKTTIDFHRVRCPLSRLVPSWQQRVDLQSSVGVEHRPGLGRLEPILPTDGPSPQKLWIPIDWKELTWKSCSQSQLGAIRYNGPEKIPKNAFRNGWNGLKDISTTNYVFLTWLGGFGTFEKKKNKWTTPEENNTSPHQPPRCCEKHEPLR